MAGKSSKKQAQANLVILRNLYLETVPIVLLALLRQWSSQGGVTGWLNFFVLHLPLLGCVYTLDSSGRPRYDSNKNLVREGMNLSQSGTLTDYVFDIVYLSLFGDLGQVLFSTKKLWYAFLLIPVYAIWKVYGLMPKSQAPRTRAQSEKPVQSKRQAKLAKKQGAVQM